LLFFFLLFSDQHFGVASPVKCSQVWGQVDIPIRPTKGEAWETGSGQFLDLHYGVASRWN
jgi:hypothetical protein